MNTGASTSPDGGCTEPPQHTEHQTPHTTHTAHNTKVESGIDPSKRAYQMHSTRHSTASHGREVETFRVCSDGPITRCALLIQWRLTIPCRGWNPEMLELADCQPARGLRRRRISQSEAQQRGTGFDVHRRNKQQHKAPALQLGLFRTVMGRCWHLRLWGREEVR
jgi:hypothetical protein